MNRLVRWWTRGGRGEDGAYLGEMRHLISSYGRFPGHEGSYPILDRLLWQVRRESRQKGGRGRGRG